MVETFPKVGIEQKKKESLEDFLKMNGIENPPKIETHFFFHSHSSAEDGKAVTDRLSDKDILIQENTGWDEERLETWKKVSRGEFTAEQAIDHEKNRGKPFLWPNYFKSIFNNLYGSNKEVLLVDIKSDNEIYDRGMKLFAKDGPYANLIDKEKTFEEVLEYISSTSKLESDIQMEREDQILDNFKQNLLKLLKEEPELQKRENLKILFSMGAFHTRLHNEMKKSGNNVTREFPTMPYTFDPRVSVQRVVHFKGADKAKEYMPRIMLLFLLQKLNLKYEDISRQVLSRFSDDQIKELFEIFKNSESDQDFINKAQPWLVAQFKKK